jgi:hypothetical protein
LQGLLGNLLFWEFIRCPNNAHARDNVRRYRIGSVATPAQVFSMSLVGAEHSMAGFALVDGSRVDPRAG